MIMNNDSGGYGNDDSDEGDDNSGGDGGDDNELQQWQHSARWRW